MKITSKTLLAGSLIFTSGFIISCRLAEPGEHSHQHPKNADVDTLFDPQRRYDPELSEIFEDHRLNTATWQIMGADGKPKEGSVNEPAQLLERYHADLAAKNPEEHQRIFPPNEEQKRLTARAMENGAKVKTSEQLINEIEDKSVRDRLKASRESFLKSKPAAQRKVRDATRVMEKDPKGPWKKIMKR